MSSFKSRENIQKIVGGPDRSVSDNQPPTRPAAVTTNKKIKTSSFKSRENIQKIEGRPDRSVSDNQPPPPATPNERAPKVRKDTATSSPIKDATH